MSWAGNNPFAALASSQPKSAAQTQRVEPKPKKNLANAKDATKVHAPKEEKKEPKKQDPKAGTGNNSAKPNRPERAADRKGRQFPKKSATGRRDEERRDGKDWGEGKKKIEDGESEAKATPNEQGENTEPHVRVEGDGKRGNRKGGGGRRGGKERVIEELTPEEEAALQAEKEAEARQMTMDEWNAKKSSPAVIDEIKEELKEARKVDSEEFKKLQPVQKKAIEGEWVSSNNNKQKQNGKKQKSKKKEFVPIASESASQNKKRDGQRERKGNNKKDETPDLKLDDNELFPTLGKKK